VHVKLSLPVTILRVVAECVKTLPIKVFIKARNQNVAKDLLLVLREGRGKGMHL